MRWIAKVVWLAGFLCTAAGCTQQCFVHECDLNHYQNIMPASLEHDPEAGLPDKYDFAGPPPVTVIQPEKREPWYLSLQEAIAIALENGNTGIQSVRQQGQISDDLITPNQFQAPGEGGQASDSIRVLALRPAVSGAAVEASLAKFDAKWISQLIWTHTDQQVQGLTSFNNGDRANFETTLIKPLATGGLAGITYSTAYNILSQPPTAFPIQNPSYLARFDVTFEQPLGQMFGVAINQLLNRHPGINPGSRAAGSAATFVNSHLGTVNQGLNAGFGNEGILIARLRFDESRAEFERVINHTLLNVETAYWNLYAAYVNLYASKQGLRQSHKLWKVLKEQEAVGTGIEADVARARGQYELFRGDYIQATGRVLEAERILRGLLNLPAEDGKQLIPIDAPTLAPYYPNWQSAVDEAVNLRPEFIAGRQELKVRQLDLMLQKNFLRPDVRFISRYGISGLGSRLDGNGAVFDTASGVFRSDNALRNLSSTNFNDWDLGLTMSIPLGYRFEHASVRRARLALAQTYMALKNEEKKAVRYLAKAYRDIFENYEVIKARRAQREGFAAKLIALERIEDVGQKEKLRLLEEVLQSQRDWVNALTQEYQAIAAYNNALAAFQFAKGTIMQHNNVHVGEGALPQCAQERAVVHEKERSIALIQRERANAVKHTPLAPEHGQFGMPILPVHEVPSVPALMEGADTAPGSPTVIGTAVSTEPTDGPVFGGFSSDTGKMPAENSINWKKAEGSVLPDAETKTTGNEMIEHNTNFRPTGTTQLPPTSNAEGNSAEMPAYLPNIPGGSAITPGSITIPQSPFGEEQSSVPSSVLQ